MSRIVALVTIASSRGALGGGGGDRVGDRQQLVVVDAPVREADPFGLGPVEHLTEHDRGHRRLRSGNPPQHPRVTTPRVQADLQEAGVELGATSRDPHVAAEGEVHAGTHGGAVDGGERRERTAGDPQEALVDGAEAATVGRPEVPEVGTGTERRRGAGHDDGTHRLVGLDGVHGGDDLGDHRRRQCVALVGVVQRERGHAVGDVGEDQGHAGSLSRSTGCSLGPEMLDHVFTDAISALRDAFEAAFLERQAFEEHFQVDVLLGDITWETSYGLPGEGQPPRVVAHITFDWPTWSQTSYRRWYVEEELDAPPVIEMEIVLRIQRLAEQPDPRAVFAALPDHSPPIGAERLERAGLTVEIGHPDPNDSAATAAAEYAVEITYEGLYELVEETLADGSSSILDDHFGVLGGWIASTLVKLGDLRLAFLPADDVETE